VSALDGADAPAADGTPAGRADAADAPGAADVPGVALPVADRAATWRAARALLRPLRARLAAALALLAAATAIQLTGPLLLGRIVDLVADGRGPDAILLPAFALLGATLLGALLVPLGTALVAEVGERALAPLREQVVAQTLALPLERVERAGAGDLHARVSEDVGEVAEAARSAVPTIAAAGLAVLLTIAGLATLDLRFALAGLCAAPFQALAVRWHLRRAASVYAAERAAVAARGDSLLTAIGGVRTIRALGLAERQAERVRARSQRELALSATAMRTWTGFFARLNAAELVGLSALLVAGFLLVRSGAATVGAATAAALYFVRLFDPINALLGLADDAQQGAAGLARLVGVTQAEPPREPARPAAPADASLAVSGLRHAYIAGHEVLGPLELRVAAGERVALVGVSGAGKSTLARIAAGVLEPSAGEVRIGGAPLAALGPRATRAAVGLVTQEVHVFAGTLADDLRLARADAADETLERALERVGALDWVRALPDGLATRVGDGGAALSALQSQQLALARLVLADPPIAILDEATAEAGSAGARVLERAADAALAGRTALVVAHRLSQAAGADRVVVLEAGRVVEDAPHDVLVHAGGAYAALWASWRGSR
jgi:ATP-binding cassette, subfamily C, bacterial